MLDFVYEGKKIAYKIDGEGLEKPLVLLNGIMMSMASWEPFMANLVVNRKIIRIDMMDQGLSEKMETNYTIYNQSKMVMALLDFLKIDRYDLFGISYGAHVALTIGTIDVNRVNKLAVFNCLPNTNNLLRDIGISWIEAAKHNDSELFFYNTIPVIYSTNFYVKNSSWLERRKPLLLKVFQKPFLQSMIRLINSGEDYDVREDLHKIKANTLVVGSTNDLLTPADLTKSITQYIDNSKYIEIPECGHASMYEKPNEFISILLGFLIHSDVSLIN